MPLRRWSFALPDKHQRIRPSTCQNVRFPSFTQQMAYKHTHTIVVQEVRDNLPQQEWMYSESFVCSEVPISEIILKNFRTLSAQISAHLAQSDAMGCRGYPVGCYWKLAKRRDHRCRRTVYQLMNGMVKTK